MSEWKGDRLAGVLQALKAGTPQTWLFKVETNVDDEIELTWPNLTQVPKDINLFLHDLEANRRLYMRTQNVYKFRPKSDGSPHRFSITAEPRETGYLLIRELRVQSSPLRTPSPMASVTFVLTQRAQIQVRLLTPTGRAVNQFQLGEGKTGLNAVQIPLTTRFESLLPRGVYLLEVAAVTSEGQMARAVRTVRLK